MKQKLVTFSVLLTMLTGCFAQSKTGLHVINTCHIATAGGWDYLEVSPANNWLYVSHGTQVNILDKKTVDSAGVFKNTTGIHGITFDTANDKGAVQSKNDITFHV